MAERNSSILIRPEASLTAIYTCGCRIQVDDATALPFTCPQHGYELKKVRAAAQAKTEFGNYPTRLIKEFVIADDD